MFPLLSSQSVQVPADLWSTDYTISARDTTLGKVVLRNIKGLVGGVIFFFRLLFS